MCCCVQLLLNPYGLSGTVWSNDGLSLVLTSEYHTSELKGGAVMRYPIILSLINITGLSIIKKM